MFIRCNHQYLMNIADDEVVVLIELTQKPQYTGAVSSSNPFDDGSMPAFKKIGFAILEVRYFPVLLILIMIIFLVLFELSSSEMIFDMNTLKSLADQH